MTKRKPKRKTKLFELEAATGCLISLSSEYKANRSVDLEITFALLHLMKAKDLLKGNR